MITVFIFLAVMWGGGENTAITDCEEFATQFSESPYKNFTTHPNWNLLPHGKCGHGKGSGIQGRIVGGFDVGEDQFPWMAKLFPNPEGSVICGGAIINNRYILTAAHCCKSLKPITSVIGLGNEDSWKSREKIKVEKVVINKGFFLCDRQTVGKDDTCLLRLKEKIKFNENIQPICLPNTENVVVGSQMVIAGWGYFSLEKPNWPAFRYPLQQLKVTVLPLNECRKYFTATDAREICVTRGMCYGDSGGPLMKSFNIDGKKTYVTFGVGSYVDECSPIGNIGAYSRITEYMQWILDNLEPS